MTGSGALLCVVVVLLAVWRKLIGEPQPHEAHDHAAYAPSARSRV
jgi:hypothetical protein